MLFRSAAAGKVISQSSVRIFHILHAVYFT